MTTQTLDEIVTNLVMCHEEDFDISSPEQRFVGLKGRIMKVITEAVAEERERCAKVVEEGCGYNLSNHYELREITTKIAAAIRKGVKP